MQQTLTEYFIQRRIETEKVYVQCKLYNFKYVAIGTVCARSCEVHWHSNTV